MNRALFVIAITLAACAPESAPSSSARRPDREWFHVSRGGYKQLRIVTRGRAACTEVDVAYRAVITRELDGNTALAEGELRDLAVRGSELVATVWLPAGDTVLSIAGRSCPLEIETVELHDA